jgi:hypothetical protein
LSTYKWTGPLHPKDGKYVYIEYCLLFSTLLLYFLQFFSLLFVPPLTNTFFFTSSVCGKGHKINFFFFSLLSSTFKCLCQTEDIKNCNYFHRFISQASGIYYETKKKHNNDVNDWINDGAHMTTSIVTFLGIQLTQYGVIYFVIASFYSWGK